VTSWNWVYLTDFASFKPTYLPLDDPSAFSFFFDTSSRRTCYLAPERFYAAGSDMAKRKDKLEFGKRDGKVTEAMDVFGLGCVLAELWMEGTPPFTLSQMFKYREGQYSPEPYLEEIEDPDTRVLLPVLRIGPGTDRALQALIRSMISLDPADRLTCDEYLSTYRTTAFPDIFYTFLHPFISSLNEASNSSATPSSATPTGLRSATGTSTPSLGVTVEAAALGGVTMQTDADDNIEKVWSEWEMIARYLDEGRERKEDRRPESAQTSKAGRSDVPLFPIRLHVPGLEGAIAEGGAETGECGFHWTDTATY
jgi:phosphoinositide-3-kinase regulatory subunit 4